MHVSLRDVRWGVPLQTGWILSVCQILSDVVWQGRARALRCLVWRWCGGVAWQSRDFAVPCLGMGWQGKAGALRCLLVAVVAVADGSVVVVRKSMGLAGRRTAAHRGASRVACCGRQGDWVLAALLVVAATGLVLVVAPADSSVPHTALAARCCQAERSWSGDQRPQPWWWP